MPYPSSTLYPSSSLYPGTSGVTGSASPWEVLVLDGLTLTGDPTGTLVLEQFSAPPPKQRQDWISAADSEGSALSRQPQHENREITVRVRVSQQASMDAALDQVGALVDKLRKASRDPGGVAMTWTPAGSARTVTFDVLAGEITDLPITWSGDDHGWFANRPVMNVTLTCKPYWRGAEVTTSLTSSGSAPYATLQVANVPGDIPALGRLIVTDTASQARRHVEWGIENQYYDPAVGWTLLIDSDSLVPTPGVGSQTTALVSGAYDPNGTGANVLRASVYGPVVTVAATGNQGHVGTYRVKARVFASAGVSLRLAWRDSDSKLTTNAFATPPVAVSFTEVDLGIITIAPAAAGTQAWSGEIQAYSLGVISGEAPLLDIDYLLLIPAGEGYGVARGEMSADTITTFLVHDEFDQTAGVLTGKISPEPGSSNWAGAGSGSEFNVDATYHYAVRNSLNDVDANTGRYMTLGSTYTDVVVQADMWRNAPPAANNFTHRYGVLARYVDTNNWLFAGIETNFVNPGSSTATLRIIKRVAGVATFLANYDVTATTGGATIRMVVESTGNVAVFFDPSAYLNNTGTNLVRVLSAWDSALATGGALATGKVGIYDAWTGNIALGRVIDNFWAATPTPSYVINSGRSLQIRYDDTIRQDSTGVYYGRPAEYRGTRFMVPPGTSRVFVKARRQDTEASTASTVTDATQVQVAYTPRGLAVPR